MTLVALGPGNERLDLTLFDDAAWDAIRAEAPPLCCLGCGGPMHTKAYQVTEPGPDEPHELRIFSHNPGAAERCRLLGNDESPEHHRLKRRLAQGARRAGWTADLEVQVTADCRADVVATNPATGRTRALEAQLARLGTADALTRHQRYVSEFGDCTWTHTGVREWSVQIPSLRVDADTHDIVVGGVITELSDLTPLPPTELVEIIPSILANRILYVFDGDWGTYLTREAMRSSSGLPRRRRRRVSSTGAARFCQRMTQLTEGERGLLSSGFVSAEDFTSALVEAHDVFRRAGYRSLSDRQWRALALAGEHPGIANQARGDFGSLRVSWN